jgi:hypothetical protein
MHYCYTFTAKYEVDLLEALKMPTLTCVYFCKYEYMQVTLRTYFAVSYAWYFLCLLYYVLLFSLYDNEAALVMYSSWM